jgi:hypothetical protein
MLSKSEKGTVSLNRLIFADVTWEVLALLKPCEMVLISLFVVALLMLHHLLEVRYLWSLLFSNYANISQLECGGITGIGKSILIKLLALSSVVT